MQIWHYSTRQNTGCPHDKYPFGMGVVDFCAGGGYSACDQGCVQHACEEGGYQVIARVNR